MTTTPVRTLTPALARRLAVMRQHLAGPRLSADPAGMLDLVRQLGCLQLDPTSAVARSHLLVLWSRLGNYDPADLDTLLWQDRSLFEYWAHAASMVLTEDYPIHHLQMRTYGQTDSKWHQHIRAWTEQNATMREMILNRLRNEGPLLAREFDGHTVSSWVTSGWNNDRNVGRMLDFLWLQGIIMVAGRKGGQKLWDLAERCLPPSTPRDQLSEYEIVYRAAQKSLRALGVAQPRQIQAHYTCGRYPGLTQVLADLEGQGYIQRVQIADENPDKTGKTKKYPGPWYVHTDDLPLLDRLAAGEWEPRTTLLSPFDNLIYDRKRTELLFDFYFRLEIYVPKEKRQYGFFVLPILYGDRLIGRIDPTMNRAQKQLMINAIYAEPDAPKTKATAKAIAGAIESLGTFLGAQQIVYPSLAEATIPAAWKTALS